MNVPHDDPGTFRTASAGSFASPAASHFSGVGVVSVNPSRNVIDCFPSAHVSLVPG